MFENYTDLSKRLSSFPQGAPIVNQINFLMEPGKELGGIIFDTDFDRNPTNISFVLFDVQKFIEGTIILNNTNPIENSLQLSIRETQDLVKKEVIYSNLNGFTPAFKDVNVNLAFKDGYELSLSFKQFKETPSNFKDFVNNLLKL